VLLLLLVAMLLLLQLLHAHAQHLGLLLIQALVCRSH
jgi:hypothetical protein